MDRFLAITLTCYNAHATPYYGKDGEPKIIQEYRDRLENYSKKLNKIDKQLDTITAPSERKELEDRYNRWADRYDDCLEKIYEQGKT